MQPCLHIGGNEDGLSHPVPNDADTVEWRVERVANFSALFAAICLRPLPSQIVISLMCGTKGLSN